MRLSFSFSGVLGSTVSERNDDFILSIYACFPHSKTCIISNCGEFAIIKIGVVILFSCLCNFRLQSYTKKMTYANMYAIFFRIYVIGSVFDDFAGDAFVAGDIDHIDAA